MKVTNFHLRIAILALGGLLILYGVVKMLFKIDLGPAIEQNLPTVIMVGAAAIFIWNRQIWNQERKREAEEAAQKEADQKEAEQIEDPKKVDPPQVP
jgi:hypothetical protein